MPSKQGISKDRDEETRKEEEKQKNKKKEKAERLNAKGWAEGCRELLVLRPCLPRYTAARQRGYIAERRAFSDICNMFHFYFPYWLGDHEEYEGPHLPYDPTKIVDPAAGFAEGSPERVMITVHVTWTNVVRDNVVGVRC